MAGRRGSLSCMPEHFNTWKKNCLPAHCFKGLKVFSAEWDYLFTYLSILQICTSQTKYINCIPEEKILHAWGEKTKRVCLP